MSSTSTIIRNWPFAIPPRPSAFTCILLASTMLSGCTLSFTLDLAEPGRTLNVYADRGWQDTGVSLREGEEVTLKVTSGRWFEDPPGVWHDASGAPDPWICGDPDCHEPLPNAPKYALIARIGEEGSPFLVGDFSRFFANEAGRLYLRANYGDQDIPIHNPEGSVQVSIEYSQ